MYTYEYLRFTQLCEPYVLGRYKLMQVACITSRTIYMYVLVWVLLWETLQLRSICCTCFDLQVCIDIYIYLFMYSNVYTCLYEKIRKGIHRQVGTDFFFRNNNCYVHNSYNTKTTPVKIMPCDALQSFAQDLQLLTIQTVHSVQALHCCYVYPDMYDCCMC